MVTPEPLVVKPMILVPTLHKPVSVSPLKFKPGVVAVPLAKDRVELKVVVPETLRDEAFKAPRLVNPVTLRPFNAPYPVIDPPTPTFPEVTKDVALMLVVCNPPFNTPSPVTVSDEPIPKLPVKFPVPITDKL